MIGINIGSQLTKFSSGNIISKKEIYKAKDFKLNPLLNDILDRVFPSIIQYKENIQLFGTSTQLGYKKYNLSTFNNLSRFIGFFYNFRINKQEKKYFLTTKNYNDYDGTFKFKLSDKEYKIYGDNCVISFLSKIDEKIKLKLNTKDKQTYIFSIPDYYTLYQEEALKQILNTLNLNYEYPFIKESTSITMYYGYLHYQELTDNNIYILFIDIGHSKTSFILSEFSKNQFSVKEVENNPFLGGRDLNQKIYDKCKEIYKTENNNEFPENARIKYRLLDEIEKARKNLSINDEALIQVEALIGEYDFNYIITRVKYEELIQEYTKIFKSALKSFWKKIKDEYKFKISKIEMGGQLMRTPILQDIVSKVTGIDISKTIALDECHSLGCLLYKLFDLKHCKFENLNKFEIYNKYEKNFINHQNLEIIISDEMEKKNETEIEIDKYSISNKSYIHFFYKKEKRFFYKRYKLYSRVKTHSSSDNKNSKNFRAGYIKNIILYLKFKNQKISLITNNKENKLFLKNIRKLKVEKNLIIKLREIETQLKKIEQSK